MHVCEGMCACVQLLLQLQRRLLLSLLLLLLLQRRLLLSLLLLLLLLLAELLLLLRRRRRRRQQQQQLLLLLGARPIGAPVTGGTSGNVDMLQTLAGAMHSEFRDFHGCKRAYVNSQVVWLSAFVGLRYTPQMQKLPFCKQS